MNNNDIKKFYDNCMKRISRNNLRPCLVCGKRHTTHSIAWNCWTGKNHTQAFRAIRIALSGSSVEVPNHCPVCSERFASEWSVQYTWMAHLYTIPLDEYEKHVIVGYML